jgi:hypothetical protein
VAVHPQSTISYGVHRAEVDEDIAELILEAWRSGCFTDFSCQEHEPGKVWVQFSSQLDAKRFTDAVGPGLVFEDISTSAANREFRATSLLFPRKDIPTIVASLKRRG